MPRTQASISGTQHFLLGALMPPPSCHGAAASPCPACKLSKRLPQHAAMGDCGALRVDALAWPRHLAAALQEAAVYNVPQEWLESQSSGVCSDRVLTICKEIAGRSKACAFDTQRALSGRNQKKFRHQDSDLRPPANSNLV
jgi:hypothetical protein